VHQAFYYLEDPELGVAEIRRVLRPGGSALISTPLVWPYHRGILEHRFTGPELEELFSGWDEVGVVENGGMGLDWLEGRYLQGSTTTLPQNLLLTARKPFCLMETFLAHCILGALTREKSDFAGVILSELREGQALATVVL
jgi:SAM-dependent methyltransferase